jgi:hypothetical protein
LIGLAASFVEAEPDGTLFNTVFPEEAEAFSEVLLEAEPEGTFKDFLEQEDDLFEASDFTGVLLTDFTITQQMLFDTGSMFDEP